MKPRCVAVGRFSELSQSPKKSSRHQVSGIGYVLMYNFFCSCRVLPCTFESGAQMVALRRYMVWWHEIDFQSLEGSCVGAVLRLNYLRKKDFNDDHNKYS